MFRCHLNLDATSRNDFESHLISGPVTVDEICKAIDAMPQGKTPGPDGIPDEFYKHYRDVLAPYLLEVFNESYSLGLLPRSFRKSHTVLIPKYTERAKLLSVSAYRPITLCNVDYKILAKVLAARLQSVITRLVGEHQTCGIKGRNIQTNIHVARSVFELCQHSARQVAFLQVDLEKAFDRVSHAFLFSLLQHLRLGDVLLRGIALCYTQMATQLVVNRELVESIPLRSSVRQGCPLSPLLFSLYLEPLCLRVLHNVHVRGFRLHLSEVKVLAYADDLAFFCEDKLSVNAILKDVTFFTVVVGARVNLEKSKGVWFGSWGTTPTSYSGFAWSLHPGVYLGVPFMHMNRVGRYWSERLGGIRKSVPLWRSRQLSVFSRAQVCNVFLVTKLVYVLQVMCCPRRYVQALHRIFAVFIWNSPYEPTRRSNLFRPVRDGGLGLGNSFCGSLFRVSSFCAHFPILSYGRIISSFCRTTCRP